MKNIINCQMYESQHPSVISSIFVQLIIALVLTLIWSMTTFAATSTVTPIYNPDEYVCIEPGYITFESMSDSFNLSINAIDGVNFTTTNGYTWIVGDFATGNYNGKYPAGSYTSQGTHWAWLGTTQGSGRIDLVDGPASSFSLLVSNGTPVQLDAYDNNGNLLATSGPAPINTNTGEMVELKITRDTADISYLIVHDSANYFTIDSICTNAEGVPYQALYDFKQNTNADGSYVRWAFDNLYDYCPEYLMKDYGCAITALTNVISSYGLRSLPDGNTVDPGYVNHFLGQEEGTHTRNCDLIFHLAAREIGDYDLVHDDSPETTLLTTRIEHIEEAISAGNLVIASIKTPSIDNHFVVFYQNASTAPDGSPDYYIVDPFRYASGDRSGKTLYEAYAVSINQLRDHMRVVVLENKAPEPGTSWAITGHSPIHLLITNPSGERTGYDQNAGIYLQDIPGSFYGIHKGIADPAGVNPPQPDSIYFGQKTLEDGTYTVEVIGTGSGPYELDFMQVSDYENSSRQTVSGETTLGQIDTFLVTDRDEQPFSLQLEVEIDIKPGNRTPAINLKSNGRTAVALISNQLFKATDVDISSVIFGPSHALTIDKNITIEDVNNDGIPDMVFHFRTKDTGIKSDDTSACLAGTLLNGMGIFGCDTFKIAP